MKIRKKIVKLFIVFCVLLCAIPISANAAVVNGNDYKHGVTHYFISSGFERYKGMNTYRPDDGGHTPNLIGSNNLIPFHGDLFNTDLGRDDSLRYGVGVTLNGQSFGQVLLTQRQWEQRKSVVGYQGQLGSAYRGMNLYIENLYTKDYLYPPVAGFVQDGTLLALPKNQVYVSINGLSQTDKNASSIVVQGANLPNSNSYGSGETFYDTAKGAYNNTDLRYGNYSAQINISNAQKYDISYETQYRTGSKYANQGNEITKNKYTGSNGNINTGTRYMESGGMLYVIINCTEKSDNSVTVNLTKESGVSASINRQSFQLVKYLNAIYAAADSNGTVVKTGNTNTSGKLTFSGLDDGFYRVKYPNPPSGITLLPGNKSAVFQLTGGTNHTVDFSLSILYDITVTLNRTDTQLGIGPVQGGTFELWKGVKGASGSKLLATKTTGVLGNLEFENLESGTYTVYYKNLSSEDVVSPARTSIVYLDSDKSIRFDLRAKDLKNGWADIVFFNEDNDYTNINSSGLCFVVKGNGVRVEVNSFSDGGITSENYTGEGCWGPAFGDLKPGTYTVEQTKAPAGYQKVNGPQSFEVKVGEHAIIEFYNPIIYDFSVTLTVPSGADQGDPALKGTAVFRNLTDKKATNVPITIQIGQETKHMTISIPAHGAITKEITISTDIAGTFAVVTSINMENDHFPTKYEINKSNNQATKQCIIKGSLNLKIEFIPPNSEYTEGTEIISAFKVYNEGTVNITPDMKLNVRLMVGTDGKVLVYDQPNIIIPWGGSNLVAFRWTVPEGMAGKTAKLAAYINNDRALEEANYNDNIAIVDRNIYSLPKSNTPDTQFAKRMPNGFTYVSPEAGASNPTASWSMWVWENDWFVKKTYTTSIETDIIKASGDPDVLSSKFENGRWNIRSGYGVKYICSANFAGTGANQCTSAQYAEILFPEFQYLKKPGYYTTMKFMGTNQFQLPDSGYGPYHFIPLWYKDGDYTVTTTVSSVWTPAGMIWRTAQCDPINIIGNAYDDWFIH